MKTCYLFYFAICGITLACHAQKSTCELKYLHSAASVQQEHAGDVVKINDNEMVAIWQQLKPINIKRYTTTSESEPVKNKLEYNGMMLLLVKSFLMDGKVVVIAECNKIKPTINYVLAYTLDQNTLQLIDKPVLLLEEPYGFGTPNKHQVRLNKSKTPAFHIITTNGMWSSKDSRKMRLTVFDKDFNKQLDKVFDFNEQEQKPVIGHVYVKDADNIVFTAKVYETFFKKEEKKGRPNYTYHIFHCTGKGTSVKDVKIESKNIFITDLLPAITANSNVQVVGF